MAWSDVRGKVVTLLGAVSITEPISLDVRVVFEFPPASVEPGNLPCFLIIPPARSGSRLSGALHRTYTSRIQFLCRDEQRTTAANIADAFSEATLTAFEQALKGDGVDAALQLIGLPDIGEVTGINYAGRDFVGFEFTITHQFVESASRAA